MQARLITAMLAAVGASVLLAACGGEERLERSELPDRLADVLPRLERAGYEVDAVAVGPDEIPILIVKEGDSAVVLAVGRGAGRRPAAVPSHVRDVSGQRFEANLQTICDPREYIAETRGARDITPRVIRIAGFCSAQS